MTFKRKILHPVKTALIYGAVSAVLVGCATVAPNSAAKAEKAEVTKKTKAPTVLEFKKGQLFSIVSVVADSDAEAKKNVAKYYKSAFPLGAKHGLKREGQLKVVASPVGDHKSDGIVFYSWPSAENEQSFEAEPAWPSIKSLRPKAWEELRIYTQEVEADMSLVFDPEKTYTLAMAWHNPENPDHYDKYMAGIKDAAESVGGRFLYKMFDPKFESNIIKTGGPGQVTLVEWDTPQGLQAFGKTSGFKENAHYLKTGVTRFEILALSAK
ncbi:MAG: hypothetical protein ABJN69_12675 [Hellea sp.]